MPSNLVISTRTVMYLLDGGARMKEEGDGGRGRGEREERKRAYHSKLVMYW